MKIEIDFLNGIPIYEQIAHRILGLIERGELKTGDQLPPSGLASCIIVADRAHMLHCK